MRALPYVLVVASLLLSSGGVAIRSHADIAAAEEPSGVCKLPEPKVHPIAELKVKNPGSSIGLNTRGHNYTHQPDLPPAATTVPAKPTSRPVPPAAPEAD